MKFSLSLYAMAIAAIRLVAAAPSAALSVTVYSDVNLEGTAYSPPLVVGNCFVLPREQRNIAESAKISTGYGCYFYHGTDCGPGQTGIYLSGTVNVLPPGLYNNLGSLWCNELP
ncbi:hypothetical protein PILCRDRAFT_829582 [Piloderma croceum F 1598]|uniref:Uncharacterized protein n=1 Tax=Piloderma croceum (strain F 1598) TaxID=765440 RepID=A0A0C3EXR0_PILCF|nr:hypothetical protein PILCRDRAFT_829582 [Piloderma croceum F 1598]